MTLFENILKGMGLLCEGASINDINNAISNMHPAIITYTNNEGDKQANGERKIYPVAYGVSTAGNPVIRAFEKEGDTTTKVPAWKLFILPNIISWKNVNDESFKDEDLSGLNKEGQDKQMNILYNVSPLSDTAKNWRKDASSIKSVPVSKKDIDNGTKYSAKDMVDFSINDTISGKKLDNVVGNNYNTDNTDLKRITAEPETKPVDKSEIQDTNMETISNDEEQVNKMYANDDPVLKNDVEKEDSEETPEITTSYNDLMNRWSSESE